MKVHIIGESWVTATVIANLLSIRNTGRTNLEEAWANVTFKIVTERTVFFSKTTVCAAWVAVRTC